MWETGQTVVHTETWMGKRWAVRPLVVVEDSVDRTLLWLPRGTVRLVPATPPHRVDPSTKEERTISNLANADWGDCPESW